MKRLTKKFGDKVILPIIPMAIDSKEDLDKFHEVRKEYQAMAIKLSEYEDTGLTPEEIVHLKEDDISEHIYHGEPPF